MFNLFTIISSIIFLLFFGLKLKENFIEQELIKTQKISQKQYREQNKDKISLRNQKWRSKNKDYYQKNKEKIKQCRKEWSEKNKEKIKEYKKKWWQEKQKAKLSQNLTK